MKKIFFLILMSLVLTAPLYADEGIRDIKSPLAFPFNGYWLIALILFALLIIGACVWLFIKRLRKPKVTKEVVLPPWEIANQKLSALLDKNYHGLGRFNAFFSGLSQIIRKYIEARFLINAPEMTTPEFLQYLNRDQKLRLEQKQVLREFLDCCDMVKFAKYGPSGKEVDQSIDIAKRFIEETTVKEELNQEG